MQISAELDSRRPRTTRDAKSSHANFLCPIGALDESIGAEPGATRAVHLIMQIATETRTRTKTLRAEQEDEDFALVELREIERQIGMRRQSR